MRRKYSPVAGCDTYQPEIEAPPPRDGCNALLGINKKDLPKIEENLDLKIAKAQLQGLKKDCLDAMEAQKKKEEFKDEELPDVKSLDVKNFL